MERTTLRFGILMIIFLVLFPAVSVAGSQFVLGEERPVKPGVFRSDGDVVGIARLLALLWEVFGDSEDEGACADAPCEKDEENRVGIDPNGHD
jgi:hypothetical protein